MPMHDSTFLYVVPSPGGRVTEEESLNHDLGKVSEWCDLWVMKLNASRTKTMMVHRSCTMHPQSPRLSLGLTVLKESDDLDILEVLTFESIFARFPEKLLKGLIGISRKSCYVFHDRLLLER